jgi:hypothetical protein
MALVGLCGFAGSGKSTVAHYLAEEYGFTRLSFASAVKDITAILFQWDREALEGNTDESREWRTQPDPFWTERLGSPWTPRKALQFVGTDLCREHVHADIWIDLLLAKIRRLGPDANVVIDDVRFVNEIRALHRENAHLLVVHRRQADGSYFPSREHALLWSSAPHILTTSLHPSEWDWLRVSGVKEMPALLNQEDRTALYRQLDLWYTKLTSGTFSSEVMVK